MRRLLTGLFLLASPVGAQVVIRQGPGQGPEALGLLDVAPAAYGVSGWKTGEWARYNITQTFGMTGQQLTRFRTISVVGAAQDRFWIEIQEESMGMMRVNQPTRKILIPFGAVTDRGMTESITLYPDSSIRRTTMIRPPARDTTRAPFPGAWESVGDETLTTPVGELKTKHYRRGSEELWIAASAGPLGVVRYRGGDLTIELVGRGSSGAKSKIPGDD